MYFLLYSQILNFVPYEGIFSKGSFLSPTTILNKIQDWKIANQLYKKHFKRQK